MMFYSTLPQGWQCPVCGQVWSPRVMKCNCRAVIHSATTKGIIWYPECFDWSDEVFTPPQTTDSPLPPETTTDQPPQE